jgi:hypothetical protein
MIASLTTSQNWKKKRPGLGISRFSLCAYLLGLPTGKRIIHHNKVWSNIFWNELGTNV